MDYDGTMTTVKNDLVSKEEAADLVGVSVRMISRYVRLGYLTKLKNDRGQVRFSGAQARAMNTFEPPVDDGDAMLTRAEAAEMIGVDQRNIGSYVLDGRLVKYTDNRGRVRFSRAQCVSMSTFRPAATGA